MASEGSNKRSYKTAISSSSSDCYYTSYSSESSCGSPHRPETETMQQFLASGAHARQGGQQTRSGDDKPKLLWEFWSDQINGWLDKVEDRGLDNPHRLIQNPPTFEPSPAVTVPLLRFQKEWLYWALDQEGSDIKGGILADEMGMGKTLQAISLVLTSRDLHLKSVASTSTASETIRCTLLICPVVALVQWAEEIERRTSKGSVKVFVYHGPKRAEVDVDFSEFDFVLTAYSTIENDYRKHIMPPKKICEHCGRGFINDRKLRTHQRKKCEPSGRKTQNQPKRGKKQHVDFSTSDEKLDMTDPSAPRGKSLLHLVKWKRIILDEAHYIKDRKTNSAKAVFALDSEYRWALSGTPLQNRVGELYSLIRFLQVFPYSYYLCKKCDCRVLDYGSPENCRNCQHPKVKHFGWWNEYIATPIQHKPHERSRRRAITLLREFVLRSVVLRRTKKERASDFALPPKVVTIRKDKMDDLQDEFYKQLYTESCVQFNSYVEAGTLKNNYAHVFGLLMRLRQAVDHPFLVLYSPTAELPHGFRENYVARCSVPLNDTSRDCREKAHIATTLKRLKKSSILHRINLTDFKSSTKIDALREEVRNMVERDGSAKGIVFSQFTTFLDLIDFSLCQSGIKCEKFVGSMNANQKEKAIRTFADDPQCQILLMSLKAGGVALNLTMASHVFLMDPWWNPAVEQQAQDRIHRIGQYKPTRVVKFVTEDTVEDRILKLQEKKELLFEGTLGESTRAMERLTEEDLCFLFET